MKIKYKFFLVLSAIFVLPSILFSNAYADDIVRGTISISPMEQSIILTPGEQYRGTITVSNPNSSTQDLIYSLSTGPYSVSGEEYDSDITTVTEYTQMADWITFDWETGVIAPNNSVEVPFTITVPDDVPAGGQYAVIKVRDSRATESNEDNGVTITEIAEIASVIYATIPGTTRETGEIAENTFPSFVLNSSLTASALIRNSGNIHTKATITLQVFPLWSDEEIYTNEEDPLTRTIMPETTRYVSQEIEIPSVGIFKVRQTVSIFGKTSVNEKIVVACPIWLLFVIIFGVILIIFWLLTKSKSRKKSKR